jgi:hypothetical protein
LHILGADRNGAVVAHQLHARLGDIVRQQRSADVAHQHRLLKAQFPERAAREIDPQAEG